MNFQRYLSAKRSVDDRAVNRRVETRLADEIEARFGGDGAGSDEFRVLEVGAGIGTGVERLLDRAWLPDRVSYTALDVNPENVAAARERLPCRAAALGYAVGRAGARGGTNERADRFVLSRGARRVELDFRVADAFDFLASADREWDLLVAHAFADLVDPAEALAAFRANLAPDGLAYCPITFDGGTIFEPVADRGFEDRLCEAFHRHLDRSGDSRAGRRLLSLASGDRTEVDGDGEDGGGGDGDGRDGDREDGNREDGDGELLAVGGSDWVVRPRDGEYPADEAYFLDCIVGMVGGAVREERERNGGPEISDDRLSAWVARRRDQIADAELVYCAHQLDLLFR